MAKSIENFLSDEDRQLILGYIEKVDQARVTWVRGKGWADPPIKGSMRWLLEEKEREWETALKIPLPGMKGKAATYWKLVMDGQRSCAIKNFLDTFKGMLVQERLSLEHREMLFTLEYGIGLCADCSHKCPCPADE